MSLKKLLDAGLSVIGTRYDKGPGMSEMSIGAQRRHGYLGNDDFWTDRGWNRANSKDQDMLEKSTRARAKVERLNAGK